MQCISQTHLLLTLSLCPKRVIANVWFQDTILVINPVTGVVEKEYGE